MSEKNLILLVEDDETALEDLVLTLKDKYELRTAVNYDFAVKHLKENYFDLIVADLKLDSRKSGIDVIKFAQKQKRAYGYILITGYSDEASIIEALKIGVQDLLKKPFSSGELLTAIAKILKTKKLEEENELLKSKLKMENELLKARLRREEQDEEIIGQSDAIKNVLVKARQVAKYSEPCLIQGESGTGKELVAKFIHRIGPRSEKPFVVVNCPTITPSLFESELFGHRKGAFTGAETAKPGLFEAANGGVLFLDEITEIPLNLQSKLLRAIETQEIRRVGETQPIKIDVQIIASTNRSLDELSDKKIIRLDLLHRISSIMITLPPLRKRKGDIPLLFRYFFNKFCDEYNIKMSFPDEQFIKNLKNKNWNGNVRQFRNFVKNYVLFKMSDINTEYEDLMIELEPEETIEGITFKFTRLNLEELEKARIMIIKQLLRKYRNNKSRAARHFGMSYAGFHRLLNSLGLGRE